jgi:2-iminobutanoate/2-iminopropanoate deaminase
MIILHSQIRNEIRVHPHRDLNFLTAAYSDDILMDCFFFVIGEASVGFKTSAFESGSIEEETIRTLDNLEAMIKQPAS